MRSRFSHGLLLLIVPLMTLTAFVNASTHIPSFESWIADKDRMAVEPTIALGPNGEVYVTGHPGDDPARRAPVYRCHPIEDKTCDVQTPGEEGAGNDAVVWATPNGDILLAEIHPFDVSESHLHIYHADTWGGPWAQVFTISNWDRPWFDDAIVNGTYTVFIAAHERNDTGVPNVMLLSSTDDGVTWGTPKRVILEEGIHRFLIDTVSSADPTYYILGQGSRLYRSTDGINFSHIGTGPVSSGFPALAVGDDGIAYVVGATSSGVSYTFYDPGRGEMSLPVTVLTEGGIDYGFPSAAGGSNNKLGVSYYKQRMEDRAWDVEYSLVLNASERSIEGRSVPALQSLAATDIHFGSLTFETVGDFHSVTRLSSGGALIAYNCDTSACINAGTSLGGRLGLARQIGGTLFG